MKGMVIKMKILIFGAGSTGRGHLAALLYENGYTDITFVDKNIALVNMLKSAKSYKVHLLGEKERVIEIKDFKIIDREDEDSIIKAFYEADLVLTAVIAENLGNVSEILVKAITERKTKKKENYLNIIACENLDNASSYLREMTYNNLDEETRAYADKYIGFPDAMISRVVPLAKDRPDYLVAEDYNEWVVRKSDFKGENFNIPFMNLVDNLEARLERKLWVHNGGHATVAYAGFLKGHKYIHEAVFDPEISSFAGEVLDELGDIVVHKHGFTNEQIRRYEHNLVVRGSIIEMKDDIARVVRDPIRKLGIRDRLMAPAIYALENKLKNDKILESIVNITLYYSPNDIESLKMKQNIENEGIRYFLEETIKLKKYPELVNRIIQIREKKVK